MAQQNNPADGLQPPLIITFGPQKETIDGMEASAIN